MLQPLDREKFVETVAEAFINDARPPKNLQYDRLNFALNLEFAEHHTQILLGNHFQDYLQSPARLNDIVAAILNFRVPQVPMVLEEALPRIFPHFVSRWTVHATEFRLRAHKVTQEFDENLTRDKHLIFAEDFAVVLAYDTPNSRLIINQTRFGPWGKSFEDLLPVAVDNLVKHTMPKFQVVQEDGMLVYVADWKDSYDASRILCTKLMDSLSGLKGERIVFIPNADSLLVTGSDDWRGLSYCFSVLKQAAEMQKPLPPIPLVYRNGAWVKFTLPQSNPLAALFRQHELEYVTAIYHNQLEQLKVSEPKGEDRFVAKFVLYQKKDGALVSTCTVTETVPTLLPKAETVNFMTCTGSSVQLVAKTTWDKAMSICGHLFQPTEFYPTRYFVREFPTPYEIHQMGIIDS